MTAIKNRLRKLETVTDDSTVCACYPRYTETYLQDLGEDAPLDSQPVLTSDPVPDVCPDCFKLTEKNSITVQLCDGTTKVRFPGAWNKGAGKQ
jgi:hypothetical protein